MKKCNTKPEPKAMKSADEKTFKIEKTWSNLYGHVVERSKADDARTRRYLRRYESEPIEFFATTEKTVGKKGIRYGSAMGSMTIRFYDEMIRMVGFWESVQSGNVIEEIAAEETNVISYARRFVKDNRWLLVGLKGVFADFDDIFLEQVVGDCLLLETVKYDAADKMSWFLAHYRTEDPS